MRRQKQLGVSTIFAALLSIAAGAPCRAQSPADAETPMALMSARTGTMRQCPANMQKVLTIRAIIPKNFNPAKPVRDVSYKPPAANEAAEDASTTLGKPVPGVLLASDPNPFHMNLTQIAVAAAAKGKQPYAEVRLILKDDAENYIWYNREGINGVGYGGHRNTLRMCGARFDQSTNPAPPHPVALFYIPMKQSSTKQPVTGSFNFGLFPKAAPDTPIFVDPKVINNG